MTRKQEARTDAGQHPEMSSPTAREPGGDRRLEEDKVPRLLRGSVIFPWRCGHWHVAHASVNGPIPMCTVIALSRFTGLHNNLKV